MRSQCRVFVVAMASFLGAIAPAFAQDAISPTTSLQSDVAPEFGTEKSTTLELHTGLIGYSIEDAYLNSKFAGGQIDVIATKKINDWLGARLDITVFMTSGTFSNQFSEEGKPFNAYFINEAAATIKPVSFFTLELGVLRTQFSTMPSEFEELGFPGLRETLQFTDDDSYKAQIFALQAIPASDTAAVKPAEAGLTTELLMYGASITSNPKDKHSFTAGLGLNHFDFRNLTTSAATDSRFLGNTVIAEGDSLARFVYGFAGYESSGMLAYRFEGGTKVNLTGAYLRNDLAPDGSNKGYLYSTGLSVPMTAKYEAQGTVGYFYNESDILPASYTSTGKGSNNRFGNVFRLGMENKKDKIKGFVQYTRANEIDDHPYTADREIIVLNLEIDYDIL